VYVRLLGQSGLARHDRLAEPEALVLRAPVTHILNPETRKQILMDSLCRSRVYWHCMATPERLPDCPYCWAIALRRLLR